MQYIASLYLGSLGFWLHSFCLYKRDILNVVHIQLTSNTKYLDQGNSYYQEIVEVDKENSSDSSSCSQN